MDGEDGSAETDVEDGEENRHLRSRDLEEHLYAGQRALQSIRYRVSGSMLVLGLASACLSLVLAEKRRQALQRHRGCLRVHVLEMANCATVYGRFVFLSLAPLADDLRVTRAVLLLDIALLLAYYAVAWLGGRSELFACHADCPGCGQQAAFEKFLGVNMLLFVCTASFSFRSSTAARMQASMWNAIALWLVIKVLANVVRGLDEFLVCGIFSMSWWWVLGGQIALHVVRRPEIRHGMQEELHRVFLVRSAQASAAGIAGLVGDCSVKEALRQAKERFRCISLAEVEEGDMGQNSSDHSLFARSVPARFGHCDAFVSHSWHDDAAAKWAALQSWRSGFVAQEAREPRVWIDKCCIDQNNIVDDLQCLPIFLSGCSRFIMLCGVTYLSRLWCIIELFTHVHAGLDIDRIVLLLVLRKGREGEDMESIKQAFQDFDAGGCQCSNPDDKARILAIIDAAFGEMQHFNAAVRAIMDEAGLREPSGASSEGEVGYSSSSSSSSS